MTTDRDQLEAMARAYAQDVYGLEQPDERCYRIARGLLANDPGLDPQAAVLDHHAQALDVVADDLATLSDGSPDAPELQAIEWTRRSARLLRAMRDRLEPPDAQPAPDAEGWYVVTADIPCHLEVRVVARSQGEAESIGEHLIDEAANGPLRAAAMSVVASGDGHVVRLVPDTAEWDDVRVAPI